MKQKCQRAAGDAAAEQAHRDETERVRGLPEMQLMQQQNSPIVVRLRRQPVMQLWQQHEQASGDKDK